jgi:hypothetical protein
MVPAKQRLLVDIAAEVMADERQNIGISYTGFCLTSLPHKRLSDDLAWQRYGHRVTLLVEPGRLKTAKGDMKLYGVPYGARARMILLYLQTQAVRTGSSQVALGRSIFMACFSKELSARDRSYMNEELTLAIEELRRGCPGSC